MKEILEKHTLWLNDEEGGRRADLRRADLREEDLRWADLRRADLREANLRRANLREADLREADLRRANLREADLRRANLFEADLREADLYGANLREADLDCSCLPLWCGGQFIADERICKQLVAHVVRIMELSEIDQPELMAKMNEYKKGWHREKEF